MECHKCKSQGQSCGKKSRGLAFFRKSQIGIQVLWRGWLKLHDLCEGWQLAKET